MPLAVNEMDGGRDEYLARLRFSSRRARGRMEYATHNQRRVALPPTDAPLSWRPRFLMPSAFVRRAIPKFGVEKEEGARKGVNFREDKIQEKMECLTFHYTNYNGDGEPGITY